MFCPECGSKNTEGADYCARCGASLLVDAEVVETTIGFDALGESGDTGALAAIVEEQACLVIRSGGGRNGETFILSDTQTSVGRDPKANIFLDDVTVSRRHALIERVGDEYVLVDRGSLNGTFVNRSRQDRVVLHDGDQLQIGKYKLTFLQP